MFTGFNLSSGYNFELYQATGSKIFSDLKKETKASIEQFMLEDGSLSGTRMQTNWFPQIEADIFISHSHKNEKAALGLAGWLKQKFGLKSFIDSSVWGYSNELLKDIDDKFCKNKTGDTYNYSKRNYSTSHVHMMLSTALTMMLDKTECVFFLNTPDSISSSGLITQTESPWIYHELAMTELIRKRKLIHYRKDTIEKGIVFEASQEALIFKYDVKFPDLKDLSQAELIKWEGVKPRKKYPLDNLYEIKNII